VGFIICAGVRDVDFEIFMFVYVVVFVMCACLYVWNF